MKGRGRSWVKRGTVSSTPRISRLSGKMEIPFVSTCLIPPRFSMAFHTAYLFSLSTYCGNHLPCVRVSQRSLSIKCPPVPCFPRKSCLYCSGFGVCLGFFFKFMRSSRNLIISFLSNEAGLLKFRDANNC